ncbi:MAG: hypothetical protein ISN64_03970 [Rickettsia sp.]|nr:hypothetical protein [Rickettsia sp.]
MFWFQLNIPDSLFHEQFFEEVIALSLVLICSVKLLNSSSENFNDQIFLEIS